MKAMHLPVELLETFVKVAETKNFTAAGKRIHRSQSAVSMQMKRLAEIVESPLFDVNGKRIRIIPWWKSLRFMSAPVSGPYPGNRLKRAGPERLVRALWCAAHTDRITGCLPGDFIPGYFRHRHIPHHHIIEPL